MPLTLLSMESFEEYASFVVALSFVECKIKWRLHEVSIYPSV
jgi:hypothetical protein